jgi:hypothetical protein
VSTGKRYLSLLSTDEELVEHLEYLSGVANEALEKIKDAGVRGAYVEIGTLIGIVNATAGAARSRLDWMKKERAAARDTYEERRAERIKAYREESARE